MIARPPCLALLWTASAALAQTTAPATMTENNVVAGTVSIDFATRVTPDGPETGAPAPGATDVYKVNLSVATRHEYTGEIVRLPDAAAKTGGRLRYDLNIAVLNPANLRQKKVVGKWTGETPLDAKTKTYDLAAGKPDGSRLRIAIDTAGGVQAFTDPFAGKLVCRLSKKDGGGPRQFTRVVDGRAVTVEVKTPAPLLFKAVELATGPLSLYPRTTVDGRLDLDRQTRSLFTDGITFAYALDGKPHADKLAGSIRRVDDADYRTSGKGRYEFNLRLNEGNAKPASQEAALPDSRGDEAAFYRIDRAVPCLTGTIEYVDTLVPGTNTVAATKCTYKLNANKLTRQQIVNFFKLWMICVGPANTG